MTTLHIRQDALQDGHYPIRLTLMRDAQREREAETTKPRFPKNMPAPQLTAETVIVSDSVAEGFLYVGSTEALAKILEEEGESSNDSVKQYEYIYIMGVARIEDQHPMVNSRWLGNKNNANFPSCVCSLAR